MKLARLIAASLLLHCTCGSAATFSWAWNDDLHAGEFVSGTIDLVEGVNDPNSVNVQVLHAMDPALFGGTWIYQGTFFLPAFEVTNGAVTKADGFFTHVTPYGDVNSMYLTKLGGFVASSQSPYGPGALQSGSNTTFSAPGIDTGVPEPTTWALMIAGFGLIGWGARLRRFDGAVRRPEVEGVGSI
jgi:hypothetical protein